MLRFYKILSSKLLQVFLGERKRNIWVFLFLIVLGASVAFLEGTSFGFLALAMTGLQSHTSLSNTWLSNWKIFSEVKGAKLFFYAAFLSILFQFFRSLVSYLCTVYSTKLAVKIQKKMQSEIYSQVLRLSYGYITRQKIGDLLEIAKAPVHFVNPLLDCLLRVFVAFLTALVIVAMMIKLHIWLTLVTICLFLIFGLFQKSMMKVILKSSDHLSKNLMTSNQDASQILQGIKIIHAFFQQKKIKTKVDQQIEIIGNTCTKMYTLSNVIPYLNEMFSVIILGSILFSAVIFVGVENSSFISVLLTFLAISYRFSTRIQNGISAFGYLSSYYGYLLRTNEILEDTTKEFFLFKGSHMKEAIREISLQNVSFRYFARTEDVLKNISFSIPRGAFVGIVGLSGSGKTSIIDLLLRLYEPTRGSISVNEIDIRKYSLESWREKFGVVTQDAFLFDETIEENIQFGSPNATSEQIIRAAKDAEIDHFIRSLPNGYQTTVGERGLRLSGGERQRIALARALLRDPEILILDEATSNLDSQSESSIHHVLERMRTQKTMLLIAHRLSTLVHSDFVLVIEQGALIEKGSHEALLRTGGRYSHLWELQTSPTILRSL